MRQYVIVVPFKVGGVHGKEMKMAEGYSDMGPEDLRQLNRSLMARVIDKACGDEQWKQRLLDEPEAAMQEAGFPESEQLQQMEVETVDFAPTDAEVRGQGMAASTGGMICMTSQGVVCVPCQV
jgi:hypothetical protein